MALSFTKPHCGLLREERIEEFNRIAAREAPDLKDAHLRGMDLRKANLSRADLRGAYLRNADLRGLDLSGARMDGASLQDARLGGALLPPELAPDEIRLSIQYGTRLRVPTGKEAPSTPEAVPVGARS